MIIVQILLLAVCSCYRDDTLTLAGSGTKTILQYNADADEEVEDLNIYIFNTQTGMNTAHLFTTGDNTIEVPFGNYEIHVLANAGKDLGEDLTLQQLKSLKYTAVGISETAIPMYGSQSVQLMGPQTVPVTLTRCPAKVEIDLEVDSGLRDMTIQSIQLKDVAASGLFFPTGEPAAKTCDLDLEYTGVQEKKKLSRSWILGENCCGTFPTITSQREKNQDNAPDGATYLLINALNGNRFCTYRVFLGENNTSDFNLRHNSVHKMHITICGEDEVDTRMDSERIEMTDNMEHPEFPGACIPGEYHLTFLPLEDNNDSYNATIEVISGDASNFLVDNATVPYTVSLGDMSSVREIPVSYKPSVVNAGSSSLIYDVTIRSGKGNVYTKRFEHTFCNELFIYTSYPSRDYPEGGDVEVQSRFTKRIECDSHRAVRVLVPGDRENLKAVCEDGFALDGWYRGLTGKIITQNERYTHTLLSASDTLSMKFKREKFFIYTNLQEAEVICFRKDPVVVSEKSAYAVDPGMMCEIRSKDLSRIVTGWYDDPVLRTDEHLVSLEPVYPFVPTENIRLYPQFR